MNSDELKQHYAKNRTCCNAKDLNIGATLRCPCCEGMATELNPVMLEDLHRVTRKRSPIDTDGDTSEHLRQFAADQLETIVDLIGLGFHPDTPFGDYCDADGLRIFSQRQAAALDDLLQSLKSLIGDVAVEDICLGHLEYHKQDGGRC